MIIEHDVIGSMNTTLHTFQISVTGMLITFSSGSYYRGGQELFNNPAYTTVTIPSPTELMHYEIWLTTGGLSVLSRKDTEDFPYSQLTNQIDRLVWFTVPANCADLTAIDIDFVKVG